MRPFLALCGPSCAWVFLTQPSSRGTPPIPKPLMETLQCVPLMPPRQLKMPGIKL